MEFRELRSISILVVLLKILNSVVNYQLKHFTFLTFFKGTAAFLNLTNNVN